MNLLKESKTVMKCLQEEKELFKQLYFWKKKINAAAED